MLLYVYPLEKQVEHYAKYGELLKIRFREIISLAKEKLNSISTPRQQPFALWSFKSLLPNITFSYYIG
jgi:hypothetical protein